MSEPLYRIRCKICHRVRTVKRRRKTCGPVCANEARRRRDPVERLAACRKAGQVSAQRRQVRLHAALEARLAGKTLAEAWLAGYRQGYGSGHNKALHGMVPRVIPALRGEGYPRSRTA